MMSSPITSLSSRAAGRLGACVRWALLGAMLPALTGCLYLLAEHKKNDVCVYTVAFHQFARGDLAQGNATRIASSADGHKRVCIRRIPIVTSRQIPKATLVDTGEEGGYPTIRFSLDHHGELSWMQVCRQMPGDAVAVLVDGFYYGAFRVPHRPKSMNAITVRIPWSQGEAEAIVKHASETYKKYNPRMFR